MLVSNSKGFTSECPVTLMNSRREPIHSSGAALAVRCHRSVMYEGNLATCRFTIESMALEVASSVGLRRRPRFLRGIVSDSFCMPIPRGLYMRWVGQLEGRLATLLMCCVMGLSISCSCLSDVVRNVPAYAALG